MASINKRKVKKLYSELYQSERKCHFSVTLSVTAIEYWRHNYWNAALSTTKTVSIGLVFCRFPEERLPCKYAMQGVNVFWCEYLLALLGSKTTLPLLQDKLKARLVTNTPIIWQVKVAYIVPIALKQNPNLTINNCKVSLLSYRQIND